MKKLMRNCLVYGQLCFLCTGCASIIHGTKQQISVTTTPAGVTVSDGDVTKKTPAILELKRDKEYILTFTKPGYRTETVRIMRVISGATLGNILAGGVVGWGVDAISGAQWRLVPETVDVKMAPASVEEIAAQKAEELLCSPEGKINQLKVLLESKQITEAEYAVMKSVYEKEAASTTVATSAQQ